MGGNQIWHWSHGFPIGDPYIIGCAWLRDFFLVTGLVILKLTQPLIPAKNPNSSKFNGTEGVHIKKWPFYYLCIRKILFVAQIIPPRGLLFVHKYLFMNTRMLKKSRFFHQIITKIPRRCQLGMLFYYGMTPKNVERGIYEYVHRKKGTIFLS